MKQTSHFFITAKMLRDLCAKSPRDRLLHRLHGVALVFHGLSASEVARMYGDSPRAVSYWVKRFKERGLKGLEEDSRPGRPSKLNPSQWEKLQAFLNQARARSRPVNAETLSAYILNEFDVSLTVRQCWRILKRLKV